MGKGTKFAAVKKIITKKTINKYKEDVLNHKTKGAEKEKLGRNVSSALFFSYNTALGPPYQVIVDTNFINFSIQNKHKCYIVATCDRDLKRRIRKVPGVPIMYITRHRYSIERRPEATIGGGSFHLSNYVNLTKNLISADMRCSGMFHCGVLIHHCFMSQATAWTEEG